MAPSGMDGVSANHKGEKRKSRGGGGTGGPRDNHVTSFPPASSTLPTSPSSCAPFLCFLSSACLFFPLLWCALLRFGSFPFFFVLSRDMGRDSLRVVTRLCPHSRCTAHFLSAQCTGMAYVEPSEHLIRIFRIKHARAPHPPPPTHTHERRDVVRPSISLLFSFFFPVFGYAISLSVAFLFPFSFVRQKTRHKENKRYVYLFKVPETCATRRE